MIPYIRQALERHYGVIILNPFLNSIKVENENQEITKVSIPYNDTPENHALYSLYSSCYLVDTFGIIFWILWPSRIFVLLLMVMVVSLPKHSFKYSDFHDFLLFNRQEKIKYSHD